MELRKAIGYKIYNLRIELDLSQEEFVSRLTPSFSRANLSIIENGLSMPSAEFLKAVSEAFNISSDWLLGINNSINLTKKENQLLDKFNQLNLEAKQTILNLIDIILKSTN